MRGYNKAIIIGNLTRDPEVRSTGTGRTVASFSVAVNRVWRDQNGETHEEATFIPAVAWGKTAEFCQGYLKKGAGVLVEGRISVRTYDKNGEKRYATEVVADNVQFAGGQTVSRPANQPARAPESIEPCLRGLAEQTDGDVLYRRPAAAPKPESAQSQMPQYEEAVDIPF